MKFSICIPNFNYEKYLPLTLDSAVSQSFKDYEIVIADNASTDRSLAIIQEFAAKHSSIHYKVNATNMGFAGNLDEAGRMAKAEWMIMLSSDDIITPQALETYHQFIQLVQSGSPFCFCSTFEKIDSDGHFLEYLSARTNSVWREHDLDQILTEKMGFPVYKVKSGELLKRCFTNFNNPFNFASTCFPRSLYQSVSGYGGGRLYNPDKWFHWKLLTQTDYVYFLDNPLFKYRWHQNNQLGQESKTGILKYWLDEYRNSFEPDQDMLAKAGITKQELMQHFCVHLMKYVFASIKQNDRTTASRLMAYGIATYPNVFRSNKYYWPFRLMLYTMPISSLLAKMVYHFIKPNSRIGNSR